MNEVARTPAAGAPSRPLPPRGTDRARAVGQLLQMSEEVLQKPWNLLRDIDEEWPDWRKKILHSPPRLQDARRNDRHGRLYVSELQERDAALPASDRLEALEAALDELAEAKPDRKKSSLLISVMVDGFPNARPHSPEAYVESLVHEAMVAKHPPQVVAQACRDLARTKPFLPSVAEFLEACTRAAGIAKVVWFVERARQTVTWIWEVLDAVESQGLIDVEADRWNYWRGLVQGWLAEAKWLIAVDGPPPGSPGCRTPAEILREFGIEPAPQPSEA